MKIVLGIFSRNEEILRISTALQKLNHEVRVIFTDDYHSVCSYYKKKLDEVGIDRGRRQYQQAIKALFMTAREEFKPDIILFVNLPQSILSLNEAADLCRDCRAVIWFVDTVRGSAAPREWLQLFDSIYVFDKSDAAYLQEAYGLRSDYCPVGFNDAYCHIKADCQPIDICFIGSAYKNRLEILEAAAGYAAANQLNMLVCGPFWDKRYFWKKWLFRQKYPHLLSFVSNKTIASHEAAALYGSAKLCLNIHTAGQQSINPRTFEIMAVGAFELMDSRADYAGLIQPGRDLAVFNDKQDCIDKIDYYLKHDNERRKIARQGCQHVRKVMSMESCMAKIISGS